MHVVKEKINANLIYKVCPEKGGKVHTLHRSLLHLVNDLPVFVTEQIISPRTEADRKEEIKLKGTESEQQQ